MFRILSLLLFSSRFIALGQPFQIENFGIEAGLPAATVSSIEEDSTGYLWVGLYGGGLARFDGSRFVLLSENDGLLNNSITSLFIDSKSNLWVGSIKGVSRYDGKTFKNYLLESTNGGYQVFEYRDSIFTHPIGNSFFTHLREDTAIAYHKNFGIRDSILKIISNRRELMVLTSSRQVELLKGAYRHTIGDKVEGIKIQDIQCFEGEFYLRTEKGMYQYSESGLKLFLRSGENSVFHIDAKDSIAWYYSNQEFVLRARQLKNVNAKDYWRAPLPYAPWVFFRDRESNLWVGTMGGGISRINRPIFKKIFQPGDAMYGKLITRVNRDYQRRLWVGSHQDGLVVLDQGKTVKHFNMGPGHEGIREIEYLADSAMLIATYCGLGIVDLKTLEWKWINRTLRVHRVKTGPEGSIWLSLASGDFGRLEKGEFVRVAGMQELDGWVWDFKFSQIHNAFFLVTDHSQLYRFDGKEIKRIPLDRHTSSIFFTVGFVKNYVVVGTDGKGLVFLDPNNPERRLYIDQSDGLASDLVNFADSDEEGHLWVATLFGVDRLELGDEMTLTSIRHYSRGDGLEGVKPNRNAYHFGTDEIYFGLVDNLYSFDQTIPRQVDFPLQLQGVYYRDSLISHENLVLSSRYNSLAFQFIKVNKTNPKSISYRYRLNGRVLPTRGIRDNFVALASLPFGQQELVAEALNEQGEVTDIVTTRFEILPPYYQTIWFKLVSFALLVGFVLLIVYWRYQRNLRMQRLMEDVRSLEAIRLRKEIGRDFHDEMGNQLARIINYVGMIKMIQNYDQVLLDKTEQTAKKLLSGTKDFIWAIDPMNDSLGNLFVHLKDFGESLLSEKQIDFEVYYQISEEITLLHGVTRQLNLIFKEALTNAFKHSDASRVVLSFSRGKENKIKIQLSDDGKGFHYSSEEASLDGLSNIKTRACKIGASLCVISEPGKGTKVVVTLNRP